MFVSGGPPHQRTISGEELSRKENRNPGFSSKLRSSPSHLKAWAPTSGGFLRMIKMVLVAKTVRQARDQSVKTGQDKQ